MCQEIDHHIAQSLNPTLVLGRRSLPQHGNLSVEVFTTRRNHRQETSQVELTSLLCSLSLEMSPNTPYRGLVILASFLSLKGKSALNVTPPQGEHTARSSALLTETLLMALPSYTINAVYYEGRPRANAYSAAFYNPIVFGFLLPAAFGTDVTGLPHGVLARLLWLFSEWAMLLPISYFLMFDFLPLLEHIHRVSLIPHSSLRWRYSFLSEISYMFKQKRSSHDRAVFCLNIATGFFVLYGAWSSTLSFFAFFFFMFWEPRLLRRKCGWWALQVLSLVSVLTYFVTKL